MVSLLLDRARSQMNLLIVSSWCPWPPVNGSKMRAYHLIRELAKSHAITLLSFAESGEESAATGLKAVCETVRFVPGNPFKPATPLRSRALFSRMPRSYAQTFSPEMNACVQAMIDRHDLALGLQIGAAIYLDGVSGVPRVFEEAEVATIRDAAAHERQPVRRARRQLTWWKLARFVRGLVDRFERTTVVSDVERDRLGEIGCDLDRVAVVPNAIDSLPSIQPNVDPTKLVYPGSVTFPANLDAVRHFVGDVLPLINCQVPEATFCVTGTTEGVSKTEMPGSNRVTFTGHVNDIEAVVAGSAVCVVPLRVGGGTRLKILQALALGTPVVATPKGAEGLAVTDGQNILIAETPSDFADAVVKVLRDQTLRQRLSAAGRELIRQHYTWDLAGRRLERVLEAAAGARTSRT